MPNLQQNIKEVRKSVVAIGFNPSPNQITILGSGFICDGKIITVAHLLSKLNEEQIKNLKANVMVEQVGNDLERYQWMPIKECKKDMKNDLAVFEFESKPENLKNLVLGNSENTEIGQDAYFIGFPYAAQLINDGFGVTLVVNKGIISNIKRDGTDPERKRNWFIIDAISNPGNSGCPVINAETNEVIGVMSISFRTPSQVVKELDIREPMHIAGAKPINLAKELLK
ncbi:MAG: trypsin-like peptidase domain-containing protein [Candidatus Staskawiczbacteria bacterium]|nr:trypsin-like peptidase domain-containing protein [Candidatus Staskawiczbacteria bacterium]